MATLTQHPLHLAGRDVTVDVRGSGPLVLFVQGGAATSHGYWLDLPERLADVATVATVDRPGVGLSPVPRSLSLAEQATHLAAVVEAIGGPAIVVGHSLGGPVSVQLAADRPDLVAALVLLDPSTFTDPSLLKNANAIFGPLAFAERAPRIIGAPILGAFKGLITWSVKRSFRKKGRTVTPLVQRSLDTVFAHDQATQVVRLLGGFAADSDALTARLRAEPMVVPGVLVTADRKAGHKATRAHEEMARLTGLDLQQWSGSGHSVHLDLPEQTVAAVRALVTAG